jgi:bifunctional UDP-N-acetylglucosamine pyrophosphorylase/glucosamine-1-phosphate N-acetyltransferase
MFTASLPEPISITAQDALRELFRCDRVYLAPGATIRMEGEITLGPGVSLSGECRFRGPVQIDAGSILSNVQLGPGTVVRAHSMLSDLRAGSRNIFGPFCFIRDNCIVADDCVLGAHVETARSAFGAGVKISHRAFVGDADVGERTIIGAGVVFCNFDGRTRQPTTVGAGVTVGSGCLLIPPLSVGENVVIGAGSIVTKDIPANMTFIQKRPPQA